MIYISQIKELCYIINLFAYIVKGNDIFSLNNAIFEAYFNIPSWPGI